MIVLFMAINLRGKACFLTGLHHTSHLKKALAIEEKTIVIDKQLFKSITCLDLSI